MTKICFLTEEGPVLKMSHLITKGFFTDERPITHTIFFFLKLRRDLYERHSVNKMTFLNVKEPDFFIRQSFNK